MRKYKVHYQLYITPIQKTGILTRVVQAHNKLGAAMRVADNAGRQIHVIKTEEV